ncbi:hypothetical protein C8F01DRAFT_1142705 [Mycena amicta]|nr:hypothetical protein C8F01DRAFT_1142705 [Mycena amicta]
MEWLLEISIDHGTEEFMTRILPQVASKKLAPSYWLHFVQHVLDHGAGHPEASLDQLILYCLETTVEQFSFLPRDADIDSTSLAGDTIKLIELCVKTKHGALCGEIFAAMRAIARAEPLHQQILQAFADLVPTLIEIIKTTTAPNPIRVFREALFDICGIMNSTTACTMGLLSDSRHRDAVVSAVETLGSLEALLSSKIQDHSSKTRILFASGLGEKRRLFSPADYDKVLAMLLRPELKKVDEAFETYFEKTFRPFQDHVVQWVKHCIQLEARTACANLFASLRSHSSSDSYLMGLLAPIIPLVAGLFQAGSCSGALRNIFESFTTEVLKSFSAQLKEYKTRKQTFESFECSQEGTCCSGCKEVRLLFLCNSPSVSFSGIAKERAHVESRLVLSSARPLLKWWTSPSYYPREPYTLKIEKKLLKHPGALWALDSLIANGKAYLSSLGDVATQKRILGGDHDKIYKAIHGRQPPAADLDSELPAASSSTAKRPAEEEASGSDPKRARTEDEN